MGSEAVILLWLKQCDLKRWPARQTGIDQQHPGAARQIKRMFKV